MSTNTAKCNVTAISLMALAFTFAHGSVVEVNNSDFSEETLAKFLQYGIKQKLQDSYSGQKDSKEAEEALKALIERLKNGEWTAARASSGSASGVTKLVTAVVNLSGKTVAEVQAIIDALDDAQIKALKARPTVAAELARMKAEELAAKVAAQVAEGGEQGLAGLF